MLLIVLLISVFIVSAIRANELNSASSEMAISTSQALFTADDYEPLFDHMSDSFRVPRSRERMSDYLDIARRELGELVSIDSISGSSDMSLLSLLADSHSASYVIHMEFTRDTADIEIEMVHADDRWQYSAYTVNAKILQP